MREHQPHIADEPHDAEEQRDGAAGRRERTQAARAEEHAFRGLGGDVCAYESSNAAHPEMCGSEQPIFDDGGNPLGAPHARVPESGLPSRGPQK